jgi:hypothetical protein
MAEDKEAFRFLSNEEFNQLPQADKLAYLAAAVSMLGELTTGTMKLFAESKKPPESDS